MFWTRRVRHPDLQQLLLLPNLKLLRFAFDGFDQQRQTRVHRFLRRRSVRVIFPPPSCGVLLLSERGLHVALLLLSAPQLLCQDALRGFGLLVAGVGRVQVEQVRGEHGLETRVFDVHLDTDTGLLQNVNI